jgi:type II secretory pathway pseudopilin PulG
MSLNSKRATRGLRCRHHVRSPRTGALVVELMLAMVVLIVGVGATLGSLSSFARLEQSNRETTLATLAARRTIEAMQAEDFRQVFAFYNENDLDDPPGVQIPGPGFVVAGLDPRANDLDGQPGRVVFPVPVGQPGFLHENLDASEDGLPRDLNGDGLLDDLDHALDYVVLPVRVRIEWRGAAGDRLIEMQTVLFARR